MAFSNPCLAAAVAKLPKLHCDTSIPHPPGIPAPLPLTEAEIAEHRAKMEHYFLVDRSMYSKTYRFSPSFHAKLNESIPKEITPDSFVKSFETYVTTTSGVTTPLGKRTWIFEISNDAKQSPVFLQCLDALKQAIESTGFTAETTYYDSHLKSGKYAILTQLPHVCGSGCLRVGCNITYKATTCTDANAKAVAICM